MHTTIRYLLLSALHDRLFLGLILLIVGAGFISFVLGSAAFLEQTEMSVVFTAAASRLILVIGVVVFVCFHIRSSFDSRELDVMLSRPVSRDQVVLAHWLGFSLVSLLLALPVLALLLLLDAPSLSGLLIWCVSLILELWFIVAFAQFAAFILRSAVMAVLASLAFYVLSRMMVLFLMTAKGAGALYVPAFLRHLLEVMSVIVPRLDLFSKSQWLLYGLPDTDSWQLFVLQAALYIALLLVACILDFRRRQF